MPSLDAKLMVVGPGLFTDYGEKIKSLAERCGFADKMKFVGAVRYSELEAVGLVLYLNYSEKKC